LKKRDCQRSFDPLGRYRLDSNLTKLTEAPHAVPPKIVSRALGHSSVVITERFYAKWNKAQQDILDTGVEELTAAVNLKT